MPRPGSLPPGLARLNRLPADDELARAKALMRGGLGGMAQGGSIPLRVDPRNPAEVIIEMD